MSRHLSASLSTHFAVGVILALSACSSASKTAPTTSTALEPFSLGKIERLHTLGGVFLASQPRPEDFEHARDSGIQTVVNLRKPEELDFDEPAVVSGLGIEYHNVPFRGAGEMTDAVLDEVRALLNDPAKKPLLLHCASAGRVGAVWLAHRVLDHGLSFEEAKAEAETVGPKSAAYADRAREYIERRQAPRN
jgi:protein tyrosine phosphatase (PTP) superfamily phosphohydrolase (DUF442 family)